MGDTEKKTHERKRKHDYMLMLFADSDEGRIRQLSIGSRTVETLALFALFVLVVLVACIVWQHERGNSYLRESNQLSARLESAEASNETLLAENAELEDLQEELSEKVTILSNTINQKVENEEANAEADAEAHSPVGYPLSASASIATSETEENMLIMTSSSGNTVQAAAAGTVLSVATDTIYENIIEIDHGNGYVTIYRNDGEAMVKEGDEVVRGSILYIIDSDNTELGYQIRYEDEYIDPLEMISIDG